MKLKTYSIQVFEDDAGLKTITLTWHHQGETEYRYFEFDLSGSFDELGDFIKSHFNDDVRDFKEWRQEERGR